MKYFIYHFTLIRYGLIRTHKWPAPNVSWLEHRTGIARSRVQTPLKSWLFQASISNCLNCVHNCDDHSILDFKFAVQRMKCFIHHFTSIPHGLVRIHKWPAPNVSGFIAQLVRASHRYLMSPLKSWLFQVSIRNCLNCVHNYDDHGLLDESFHCEKCFLILTFFGLRH